MSQSLNRRHKAGLFFTVVATAASLIAGTGWAKTIGVALLSLALTWLIGALRPIHLCWVASLAGLLLAFGSVAWQCDSAGHTYAYHRRVYDLLTETPKYVAHDPKTGQNEYWDEIQQRWLRLDQKSGSIESWDKEDALIPGRMSDHQFATWLKEQHPELADVPDVELIVKVLQRRPDLHSDVSRGEVFAQGDEKRWALLARPASLRAVLREEWVLASVGITVFLGGIMGVRLVRSYTVKQHKIARE